MQQFKLCIMNEIIKNIYERRAIRKYKNKPVPKEIIDQIIAAGKMAPSAMNRQPWKFYVLTDDSKITTLSREIEQLAMSKFGPIQVKTPATLGTYHLSAAPPTVEDPIFHEAPVVIFLTTPHSDEWSGLDIGMCAENMMLAAKALGLDTCPVGFARYVTETAHFHILNIPVSEQVHIAIILGYGDEQAVMHERVGNNVVYID